MARRDATKKTVGSAIARARRAKGWSVTELAERVGCGRETVMYWEAGVSSVSTNTGYATKVGELLGLDIRKLQGLPPV